MKKKKKTSKHVDFPKIESQRLFPIGVKLLSFVSILVQLQTHHQNTERRVEKMIESKISTTKPECSMATRSPSTA